MNTDLGSITNTSPLHLVGLTSRFVRDLMSPTKRLGLKAAMPFLFASASALAQVQFLPEVDPYFKFDQRIRVYFEAKEDRDAGSPTQATLGPSLQLTFKPLVKLQNVAAFDLDVVVNPSHTRNRLRQTFG